MKATTVPKISYATAFYIGRVLRQTLNYIDYADDDVKDDVRRWKQLYDEGGRWREGQQYADARIIGEIIERLEP
jgi:hypothetical protein